MRAMALRSILFIPDKLLRTTSAKVEKITPDIRRLVEDMFETMYDAPGIGLAAVQVGVARRVVTMDLGKRRAEGADGDDETEDSEDSEGQEAVRAPRVLI